MFYDFVLSMIGTPPSGLEWVPYMIAGVFMLILIALIVRYFFGAIFQLFR
nr:MAG TPA: hypothetical protein [Inoviridae sp.]